jgi:hypothetical protein
MRCRALDLLHAIGCEFELGGAGVAAILGPLGFAWFSDLDVEVNKRGGVVTVAGYENAGGGSV